MPDSGYYSPFSGAEVDSAVSIALNLGSGAIVSSGGSVTITADNGAYVDGSRIATEGYVSGAIASIPINSGAVLEVVSGAGYTTSGAAVSLTSDVIEQYVSGGYLERKITVSRDWVTTVATIPVLSGGTFYMFEKPLSGLTIDSVVSDTDDSYVKFTLASGAVVVPYNLTLLNADASISAGSSYLLGFMANMMVVAPITEPEPLPNSAGVWIVSGSTVLFSSMSAFEVPVSSGQTINIYNGGVAVSATVSSGGSAVIYSGGQASATSINSGGNTVVSSGGVGTNELVSGGTVIVSTGGSVGAPTISSGGSVIISSGGTATGGVISNSGTIIIDSGGVGSGTTVSSGGSITVSSGGVAGGTIISSGGTTIVSSGGLISNGIINSSGVVVIQSGGTGEDSIISAGGVVISEGGITGLINVYLGGDLVREYPSPCALAQASGGEVLVVNPGGSIYSATLSGGSLVVSSGGVVSNIGASTANIELQPGASVGEAYAQGGVVSLTSGASADSIAMQYADLLVSSHDILVTSTVVSADSSTIRAQLQSAGVDISSATVTITEGKVTVTQPSVRCYMSKNVVTTAVDPSLYNATAVETFVGVLSPEYAGEAAPVLFRHDINYTYEIPATCVEIYSGGSCDAYVNKPEMTPVSWYPATPEDADPAVSTYTVKYEEIRSPIIPRLDYTTSTVTSSRTVYEYIPDSSGGAYISGVVTSLYALGVRVEINNTADISTASINNTTDPRINGNISQLSLSSTFFSRTDIPFNAQNVSEVHLDNVYGSNLQLNAGSGAIITMYNVSGIPTSGGSELALLGSVAAATSDVSSVVVTGRNVGQVFAGGITLGKEDRDSPLETRYRNGGKDVPWFFVCSAVEVYPFMSGTLDFAYGASALTILDGGVLSSGGDLGSGTIVVSGGTAHNIYAETGDLFATSAVLSFDYGGGVFDTFVASDTEIYQAEHPLEPSEITLNSAQLTGCYVYAGDGVYGTFSLRDSYITGYVTTDDPDLDDLSSMVLAGGRVRVNGPRTTTCPCGEVVTVDRVVFSSGAVTVATIESRWETALESACNNVCS